MHALPVLAILLLASVSSAAEPAAQEGWRAARFGMTPDEVVAAFPKEAVRVSPEVKLADGSTIAARIDGYAFIDMRQTRWNRGTSRADLKYIPGVVAIIHYPRPAAQ